MHTTRLRKVGGSVMLAVPPSFLDNLGLAAEKLVGLDIVNGELIVRPAQKRYSLEELLSQGEASETPDEDQAFVNSGPVGNELI